MKHTLSVMLCPFRLQMASLLQFHFPKHCQEKKKSLPLMAKLELTAADSFFLNLKLSQSINVSAPQDRETQQDIYMDLIITFT